MKISIDAVSAPTGTTWGQCFAAGEVPADSGFTLNGKPVQVDQRATDKTGLRFAGLSAILPVGASGNLDLLPIAAAPQPPSNAVLPANLGLSISLKMVDGTIWIGNMAGATLLRKWLDGPIACEWEYRMHFIDALSVHPHLSARVNVRSYAGIAGERVDITMENCDAWAAAPSNYTYETTILIRGVAKLIPSLTHYRRTRWRYVASTLPPEAIIRPDSAYLRKTGAVPNYDSITIDEATLNVWQVKALLAKPMGNIMLNPVMPDTGGRPEIGILPAWGAAYVISMDARARAATLAVGDLAGSWPIHYRDGSTDRPVSLVYYPDLTIMGNPGDTSHPFPKCAAPADCTPSPLHPDDAHQPSLAYLPYIITLDHYYLEELQFWANYNVISANPAYRNFDQGVMKFGEVRGQAWSLRSLAQAAFVTPDADSFKAYFSMCLNNTLDWFAANITNGLGIVASGIGPYLGSNGFAPWQDDFFTQSVGYAAGMGFEKALPVLRLKAKCPVGRMLDMCWIQASAYAMLGRPLISDPIYSMWAEVEQATFASVIVGSPPVKYLDLACDLQRVADFLTVQLATKHVAGQMVGYASLPDGYPSNLQPALAAAVDSGIPRAAEAWAKFMSRTVKPNYSTSPQFAIVPRNAVSSIPVPIPTPIPTPTPSPTPMPTNEMSIPVPGGVVKIVATFSAMQIPVPIPTPVPVPPPPPPVVDQTLSAFEKILLNLPADSWYEAPSSAPSLVGPPGAAAIITAWGGGAYDAVHRKMLIWGGGHADYTGNEVYAFDLRKGAWEKLTEPSPGPFTMDPLGDGNPVSRHTYGMLSYVTKTSKLFAAGGARALDGSGTPITWLFDVDTRKWTKALDTMPTGCYIGGASNTCSYDDVGNMVLARAHGVLAAYDVAANFWAILAGFGSKPLWPRYDVYGNKSSAIDTKRRLFWSVGSNDCLVWDIANKKLVTDLWKTTGGGDYTNAPRLGVTPAVMPVPPVPQVQNYPDQVFTSGGGDIYNANAPGFDYDSKADCFLGWNGGSPWVLDCTTKVWTKKSGLGAPGIPTKNGVYGRLRYLPYLNVFILVNSWTGNVLFYKNTAGGLV